MYKKSNRFSPDVRQRTVRMVQCQFQFGIDAVNPFVLSSKVLHVAQLQAEQAKAPVAVVVRQADQPVGDLLVLGVELGLIAVTGLTDGKYCACQSNGYAPL